MGMSTVFNEAFLRANIAIAIQPLIHNFLVRGEKRVVTLQAKADPAQIVELTGVEARDFLDRSKRQRSKSPRKRARDPDQTHESYEVPTLKRQCTREWRSKSHEDVLTSAFTASRASSDDPSTPEELRPGASSGRAE